MSDDERCPERVWRGGTWNGGYETCGKPVKRHGVCGVHARKVDQRSARLAEQDKSIALRREVVQLAESLTERFGVRFGVAGERVVLDAEAAGALLEHDRSEVTGN